MKKSFVLAVAALLYFYLSIFYSIYTHETDVDLYTEIMHNSIEIGNGYWHSIALDNNGDLWSWGSNWYGQLGNGNTQMQLCPQKVNSINSIISVSCGHGHSLALKNDGTVWAWGDNRKGQLGVGDVEDVLEPIQIKGLNNIIDITCGHSYSLFLDKNGDVWSVGDNTKGQLGIGSLEDDRFPQKVKGLENIISISAGKSHSVALDVDGYVWVWGGTVSLGDGTTRLHKSPIRIESLNSIVEVSCGGSHTIALKSDGTVWAWGSNGNGQLGDGTTKLRTVPVQVTNLKNIRSISCGESFSMALSNDGIIWTWGGGSPLGEGTTSAYTIPKCINLLQNVEKMFSIYNQRFAILKSGEVWAWGNNECAQLGDGTLTDKIVPTKIVSEFINAGVDENKSLSFISCNSINKFKQNLTACNSIITEKNKAMFINQWGLKNIGQEFCGDIGLNGKDINIVPAWEITKGNQSVVIGVLDTGVDIKHENLVNNIYINPNEIPNNCVDDDQNAYIDDIFGWDFVNNDNSVYDMNLEDLHGTFVAGVIGGHFQSEYNEGISGVAPNIKLLSLKFMCGDSSYSSDAIRAIKYASDMNVSIVNASFGSTILHHELKQSMESVDILFVCASGNFGKDVSVEPFYPACFEIPNIISVAAIDSKGNLYSDSNYGKEVDVAAPGVNIISTFPDNDYGITSGTSAAAPFVSGIAALLKSVELESDSTRLSSAIINSTNIEYNLRNKVSSGGIVDAYKALKYLIEEYK